MAIRALLAQAESRLTGEWLLVGGALASIWFSPGRVTEAVDLIALGGTNAERLALMELATSVGLPVEAVNSAADYFVQKTPGWRDELEVLFEAANLKILRPTPTFFIVLKMARLTEQDLDDCLLLLDFAEREALAVDHDRLQKALGALLPTEDAPLRARRARLRERLSL